MTTNKWNDSSWESCRGARKGEWVAMLRGVKTWSCEASSHLQLSHEVNVSNDIVPSLSFQYNWCIVSSDLGSCFSVYISVAFLNGKCFPCETFKLMSHVWGRLLLTLGIAELKGDVVAPLYIWASCPRVPLINIKCRMLYENVARFSQVCETQYG